MLMMHKNKSISSSKKEKEKRFCLTSILLYIGSIKNVNANYKLMI